MKRKHLKYLAAGIAFLAGCSSTDKASNTSTKTVKSLNAQEVKISAAEQKKQEKIQEEIEKSLKTDMSISEERFKNAYRSQNEDSLLKSAAELLSKNADNVDVLLGLSDHYLRKGFPDVARIFYSRILEKRPDHPDVNNNLGVLAMKEEKEAEAVVYFKKALQGNRKHTGANFNLGTYYLKYMDYEKAEMFLENAYDQDSKNYNVGNNYAVALRGTGQLDKALGVYKSIEGRSSSSVSMLNQAILLAEFKKDYKAAREIVSKIRFITTDPGVLRKVNALVLKIDESEKRK